MLINHSFGPEFDKLWSRLKSKYPEALFDIEGVGKQLDGCVFAREFFGNEVAADSSVDPNANVTDNSVIVYNTESDKPIKKLHSFYVLWDKLKTLYGKKIADEIIEMQISGDIYIHDAHGIASGMPYSYHKHTSIIIKRNEIVQFTTMEGLFKEYYTNVEVLADRETINLKSENIQILDKDNKWIKLEHILKHKNHTELVKLETKNGYSTIVTLDHPVILEDGSEKYAEELSLEDKLMISNCKVYLDEKVTMEEDFAYLIGFFLGDGWVEYQEGKTTDIRHGRINIRQNDIENTKIYKVVKKYFSNVTTIKNGTQIYFGGKSDVIDFLQYNTGAENKQLPNDILHWNKTAIKSLLCGLIDSDGNVNTNGVVSLRVTSFALVQQVSEILRALNCGTSRTSFIGIPSSKNSYKSNLEMYRVSLRLTDLDFIAYSNKVQAKAHEVFKSVAKDGRFESNKLHRIEIFDNKEEYVYDITTETGHFHSQGLIQHNCFNYTCYDLMSQGLSVVTKIQCLPPKYFTAFKSQLEQFTVVASNSTLGATGLADMLICMSWYYKKMLETLSDEHFKFASAEDVKKYVKASLVSMIYTFNQPMRANQSPFTNVSIYDDEFLDALLPDYLFPDGSTPDKELVKELQVMFLDCMNEELRRNALTFPVTTSCHAVDKDGNIKDKAFLKMIAEKNMEFAFINIYCGDSATISSCCRLRSEGKGKNEYFNSFGSGSTKIGSLGVCSINFPRLAYRYKDLDIFKAKLVEMVRVAAYVNNAKREVVKQRIENGNEPLYSLGFMELDHQYSTCGVNGLNECVEILGYDILEESGTNLVVDLIDMINAENDKYQEMYHAPHNCEQVPKMSGNKVA